MTLHPYLVPLVQKGAKCIFIIFELMIQNNCPSHYLNCDKISDLCNKYLFGYPGILKGAKCIFAFLFCAERCHLLYCLCRKVPSDTWHLSAQTSLNHLIFIIFINNWNICILSILWNVLLVCIYENTYVYITNLWSVRTNRPYCAERCQAHFSLFSSLLFKTIVLHTILTVTKFQIYAINIFWAIMACSQVPSACLHFVLCRKVPSAQTSLNHQIFIIFINSWNICIFSILWNVFLLWYIWKYLHSALFAWKFSSKMFCAERCQVQNSIFGTENIPLQTSILQRK